MDTTTPEDLRPILNWEFEHLGIPIGYRIKRSDDQAMGDDDMTKVMTLLTDLGHNVLNSGLGSFDDDPHYSCVLVEKSIGFADLLMLAEEAGYRLHLSDEAKNAMSGV